MIIHKFAGASARSRTRWDYFREFQRGRGVPKNKLITYQMRDRRGSNSTGKGVVGSAVGGAKLLVFDWAWLTH